VTFARVKATPHRSRFKVIVGGSGGWQIAQTDSWVELGVDCVVEGRSESTDLFENALAGEPIPRQLDVHHPKDRDAITFPDKRTTFGVVEMTTVCGRRCQFCLPNREALLDLYGSIVNTPGVEQHVLSHSTMAPAVVDPVLIRKLSELLLDKSPIRVSMLSSRPDGRVLVPLIGLETGSVRLAKQIMPSKGVPFPIDEWPSVVVRGLEVLNANDWFPAVTLIIGSPGETDEDVKASIDLIMEVERRGLFAFFIPSIFTPLHDTRLADKRGVDETRQLSPLQWQLLMKCWKMNLRPGQVSWWGPAAWRVGALGLWAWKLRKLNGPAFTWPLLMFASAMPESWMVKMGKLYEGRPVRIKPRRELLATIRPGHRQYVRLDTGDIPAHWATEPIQRIGELGQVVPHPHGRLRAAYQTVPMSPIPPPMRNVASGPMRDQRTAATTGARQNANDRTPQ
jgi:hypothetical protein